MSHPQAIPHFSVGAIGLLFCLAATPVAYSQTNETFRISDLEEVEVQNAQGEVSEGASHQNAPSKPAPIQADDLLTEAEIMQVQGEAAAPAAPSAAAQNPANPNPPAPPRPNANNANRNRNRASNLNTASRSSNSPVPNIMGDFFGGGVSLLNGVDRRPFQVAATGFILNGQPNGSANAFLGYQVGGVLPDDAFSNGVGRDTNNNGRIDTFDILEPIPPSGAPTSPGPGFTFDGGTAFYVDNGGDFADGDNWTLNYSYSQPLANAALGGVVVAGPDVTSRRVKISENFSPEVRNRFFTNYSFFNDVYGGLGDVSRWIVGTERVVWDRNASIEVRLPMAATYSGDQQITGGNDRSFELGNPTFIGKIVLLRYDNFTWSAGTGVTATLADDSRLKQGAMDLLVIRNESVHLLPFTGALFKASNSTFIQAYAQLDVDANGNSVYGDMAGGNLPFLGKFTDTTLLHLDAAINQSIFNNPRGDILTSAFLNAEIHYTTTTSSSDAVLGNGIAFRNLTDQFNVLNATFGSHLILGNSLVVSPAMAIPLRDGFDEQFDYEALLQVNYLY